MSDILCLDTEPETIALLTSKGHRVVAAPFGYREGIRYLPNPPQDFDLIVCDLRRPACFDATKWGPYGGNSNFKCAVLSGDDVNWESRWVSQGYNSPPREELRHQLLYETQIEHMSPGSPFGPKDVFRAIALAGVPALLFLNHEWALRTDGYSFPAFVGLRWTTAETSAVKFRTLPPLSQMVSQWSAPLEITVPVRCLVKGAPECRYKDVVSNIGTESIVTDRVGDALGQLVRCGQGAIWLFPRTNSNSVTAAQFAGMLPI